MARIAGVNIPQNKLVHIGLTYIYGIGDKFSKQICTALDFPKKKRLFMKKLFGDKFNGSGKWDRTTDLRLMSPAL